MKRTRTGGHKGVVETDETATGFSGSREAMLGAEGLRVSKAIDTVPANAPDDARPSAYAESEADVPADEETRGSREASLGGTAPKSRAAGRLIR